MKVPDGFKAEQTGGGCTAWYRAINQHYHILVTDQMDTIAPQKWPVDMGLMDTARGGPEVTMIIGVPEARFTDAVALLVGTAVDLTKAAPGAEHTAQLLRDGIAAAEEVLARWSEGNLAAAVRGLDAWVEGARKPLPAGSAWRREYRPMTTIAVHGSMLRKALYALQFLHTAVLDSRPDVLDSAHCSKDRALQLALVQASEALQL
jgi:hypothetical protein